MFSNCYFFQRLGVKVLACFSIALLFIGQPITLSAQTPTEICDNGLDDDGDGLIDCYDQDCTCTGQCDDLFLTALNVEL